MVIVTPRGRRGGGKEQCDQRLQGTTQQHPSALSRLFAWVSSGKRCFGSSQLQGTLVGPGCPAAASSLGKWRPPPTCASICPKSLHGAFCRDHPSHRLQDGPSGMAGWPGASWCMAIESKGAVSRAKCSTPFANILCCCLQCHFKT